MTQLYVRSESDFREAFYHNHPSGMPDPSQADIAITQRLKQALELFDVRVVDHIIVAETLFSFSEAGML